MHTTIKVLESRMSKDNPARYEPIMYGESVMDRIQGNYGLGKRASDIKKSGGEK